ncbi:PAS domain-containing protein, partial [Neorhizobium sp. SHOUNA12B]
MTKLQQSGNYDAPLVEKGTRGGTIVRIVLLALVLCGVAAGFVMFQHALDNELVLGLLGILAMVGIFFLVSSIIGLVEVMPQSRSDELARGFLANHPDGILITDAKGRILYANAAYGRMTGATKASNVQSLEALLSKTRESTEALYRLTTALREGREGHEEFRLLQPIGRTTGNGSGAHWYRLKARLLTPADSRKGQLDIWQITDITSERDDQERFFRELQNAIDYLDHAPAGFFSAGKKGEIFYLNATLAEWLGIDLTKFVPRSVTIADLVAGEGMALIQSVQAAPGLKRTETLDLDLRRANGQSLPVRLVHNVS